MHHRQSQNTLRARMVDAEVMKLERRNARLAVVHAHETRSRRGRDKVPERQRVDSR